jgi:hypothetical protein
MHFIKMILKFVLIVVLRMLVSAQDLDDVTFSGIVMDERGNVIEKAKVTVIHTSTGTERAVSSDKNGQYRIIEIAPGIYNVIVGAAGFREVKREAILTVSGQNIQLDFALYPLGIAEEQTIVDSSNEFLVDTKRTMVGRTITKEELESLPVSSRASLDLVLTLGGVTEEPLSTRDLAEDKGEIYRNTPEEAGIFSLSGGPAYSNNLTIDGFDNNDDRSAVERFQPSMEAIEEVQVITNQFSSEYGRASGGRVNLRTRGGSNEFKGRIFYFFRDESLNANTQRNNSLNLKRVPFQEHNPGFTLSGPIKLPFGLLNFGELKNRTFFSFTYEYNTVLDNAVINTMVPVKTNPAFPLPKPTSVPIPNVEVGLYTSVINTPLRNHTYVGRIDHVFNNMHNGTVSYQAGRYKNLRQFSGGSQLAEGLKGRKRNTDAINYTDNYVFNPYLVNQFRVQFSRLDPKFKAEGDGPVIVITVPEVDGKGTDSLVAGASTLGATDRREDRLHLQNSFSVLRGNHSFKFGGEAHLVQSTFIDLEDVSGTYNFTNVEDFLANTPSRFRQRFQTRSTQRNKYLGVFAHDEWQIKSNLTLSYGIRYEDESIIEDRNNWAPRVAIAFDPFNSKKSVIRAGAGLFYNRVLLRTVDDFSLGKGKLLFDTNALINPDTGKALTPAERRAFITNNLRFPQTLNADSNLVKQYGMGETNFLRKLDPHLRIPESYQFNVGFEREFGRATIIEVNYTHNRGIHLWREVNINAPILPKGHKDFTRYLLSRDFPNFRDQNNVRPLYNTQRAGDWVRFVDYPVNSDAISRISENGSFITLVNLNSLRSPTAIEIAQAALNDLRMKPVFGQIEQISSIGNSFYHGLSIEMRQRFVSNSKGLGWSYRAAYTLSKLIDDGSVNTSSALIPGDFRRERARSLTDRRHRFSLAGTFDLPHQLWQIRLSTIMRLASGAPFNISIGGMDRNLDDVGTDRPNYSGDIKDLRWRRPGKPIDGNVINAFSLPTIGQVGNLPRNVGTGPGLFLMDLNITREFHLGEMIRIRPVVEIDNVLNKTVYSFGAEYVNFSALESSANSRQVFLNSFLVPNRTLRPRTFRLGIRFDF